MHAAEVDTSESQDLRSGQLCRQDNGETDPGVLASENGGKLCCTQAEQALPPQMDVPDHLSPQLTCPSPSEQNLSPGMGSYLSADANLAAREEQPANCFPASQGSGLDASQGKYTNHVGAAIPMPSRVVIGTKCKRLIDHARLQYLLSAGLQVKPPFKHNEDFLWNPRIASDHCKHCQGLCKLRMGDPDAALSPDLDTKHRSE